MKGLGMNSMIKLVTFAAGHVFKEIEIHEGFTDDEWKGELRRAITYCASEDKPLSFFIDEYKLIKDLWYSDLECLIRNNMSTDVIKKSELNLVLANIHKDVEREKKAATKGLTTGDFKKDDNAQGGQGNKEEK